MEGGQFSREEPPGPTRKQKEVQGVRRRTGLIVWNSRWLGMLQPESSRVLLHPNNKTNHHGDECHICPMDYIELSRYTKRHMYKFIGSFYTLNKVIGLHFYQHLGL